jgi:hypothetical protein
MQVNSIGALNSSSSTSFKSKQEDCPSCNNQSSSMITIPRVVYAALLATIIGGPLTSCGKNPTGPEVPPITVEDTTSTVIQNQLSDLIQQMNLASVVGVNSNSLIKKGDLIGLGYHDGNYNDDINLKINDDLSTKDKMVFDGTSYYLESGKLTYIRYTATPTVLNDSAVVLNKQRTLGDQPISDNSTFVDEGTFKYVPTEGGVAEYKLLPDGTWVYESTYTPKTSTSVTKTYDNGQENDLTNISVVTK